MVFFRNFRATKLERHQRGPSLRQAFGEPRWKILGVRSKITEGSPILRLYTAFPSIVAIHMSTGNIIPRGFICRACQKSPWRFGLSYRECAREQYRGGKARKREKHEFTERRGGAGRGKVAKFKAKASYEQIRKTYKVKFVSFLRGKGVE